jgi:hypothetical protein
MVGLFRSIFSAGLRSLADPEGGQQVVQDINSPLRN